MSLEYPTHEPSTVPAVHPHSAPEWMRITLWATGPDRARESSGHKPGPRVKAHPVIYVVNGHEKRYAHVNQLAAELGVCRGSVRGALSTGCKLKGGTVREAPLEPLAPETDI